MPFHRRLYSVIRSVRISVVVIFASIRDASFAVALLSLDVHSHSRTKGILRYRPSMHRERGTHTECRERSRRTLL